MIQAPPPRVYTPVPAIVYQFPTPARTLATMSVSPRGCDWTLEGERYSIDRSGDAVALLNGKGHVILVIRFTGNIKFYAFQRPVDDPLPASGIQRATVDGKQYTVKQGPGGVAIYNAAGHIILAIVPMDQPATDKEHI